MDFSVDSKEFTPPCDTEKVKRLTHLVDDGFAEQLLVSQDICFKISLKAFGGQGYDHILRNILPMMRKAGISEETIHQIMVRNPARVLAF
jgi:phosphotriesterase-related protein